MGVAAILAPSGLELKVKPQPKVGPLEIEIAKFLGLIYQSVAINVCIIINVNTGTNISYELMCLVVRYNRIII